MKFNLINRALLKVSGADSEEFLQNQLSNDISKIDNLDIQVNAYCQHQGKIIALFWVIRFEDSFFLSFPSDLVAKVFDRLQMFVIMSDVLIEDVSSQFDQIGLINEKSDSAFSINESLSLEIHSSGVLTKEINDNTDEWTKACIDYKIPEMYLNISEKLVPQMLNLDINEVGVNFSKGCYPGQEVVARLHYLGEAKRRLFSFKSESEMHVGDSLYCVFSKAAKARGNRYKGSGTVVNKVKYNSLFYCLATLDVDLIDSRITLNNEHGPTLTRISNE
ncbi:folate-binding protein YgfZ [Candidatus Thioglobus sp.]|nr:folate-binding protein YgfZ [Candidatus Thioglobus sp.]